MFMVFRNPSLTIIVYLNQSTVLDEKRNSSVELEVGEHDDKEEAEDRDGPNDED
jgi:hypothetical protein